MYSGEPMNPWEQAKGMVLKRFVWTGLILATAACEPPPPTKEELLAKWGASYRDCLQKYAAADSVTPLEQTEACKTQFERFEQIFTELDVKLRIKPPNLGGDGAMAVTATNTSKTDRLYREFTIRIIFYPDTVKFVGEAGARKTHEEFWTVRADLAPGETGTFIKRPERPLKHDSEHYYHFAYGAKFVSLK